MNNYIEQGDWILFHKDFLINKKTIHHAEKEGENQTTLFLNDGSFYTVKVPIESIFTMVV